MIVMEEKLKKNMSKIDYIIGQLNLRSHFEDTENITVNYL